MRHRALNSVSDRRSLARWIALVATVTHALAWSSIALSQDLVPEKAIGVRERPRPEYEAAGMRVGALALYPTFAVAEAHDDNIFATQTAEVDDFTTAVEGGFSVRAEGRTPWAAFGELSSVSYSDHPQQDYSDWRGGASLQRELGRLTSANLAGSYSRSHEDRGDPSSPLFAITPPAIDTARAELGIDHLFAASRLAFAAVVESNDYNDVRLTDGTTLDQHFRDRTISNLQLRNDFAIARTIGMFVRATRTQQHYKTREAADLDRDSVTNALYGGASFQISNLMKGEIGIGILDVNNRAPAQPDRRTLALSSGIDFYLTQLITARLDLQRTSGAADIAGSASYIATTLGLNLDYELRRNVILTGNVSQSRRDYTGISDTDTGTLARLTAQWLVNRRARFEMAYSLEHRRFAFPSAGRTYAERILSATVSFAL